MSKSFGQTTAPGGASTAEQAGEQTSLALVIAWSASEPHRVGEVAFFPPKERVLVGRGDVEIEKFARFVRQRPGELAPADPRQAILGGATLSRRQLTVRFMGDALEVAQIGKCRTYFNGQEQPEGILRPGDTVRLKGEAVLLCVPRPRMLRALPWQRELHAFGEPDDSGIVGESEAAYRMREQLERAARGHTHVIIRGDSGTGKELAARVIQRQSSRANGPFVRRNASVFTGTLIASELFGNPANYPNPGMPARKGLIRTADGGTLYFDEIGDCPLDVQAQLLRVMDEGECQAVGEAVSTRVDVRFVGATNRGDDVFRPDFLARFLTCVRLPPLRERREDIPLLARHFLLGEAETSKELRERFCRKVNGRLEPNISGRLIDELLRHPLPLNARQLQSLLLQAVDTSEGNELRLPREWEKTTASAAPAPVPAAPAPVPATAAPVPPAAQATPPRASRVEKAEESALPPGSPSREDMLASLRKAKGNVVHASQESGIERTRFYRLMKDYGITRDSWDSGDSEE